MTLHRYLLTSILMGVLALNLNAQNQSYKEEYYKPDTSEFEQFVKDAFGDRADELVFSDQIRYLIMKDFFENRLTIVDRNPDIEIPDFFTDLSEVGTFDYAPPPSYTNGNMAPKTFNPFFYKINFTRNTEKTAYYHISGTHYYLKITPFDRNRINNLRQD